MILSKTILKGNTYNVMVLPKQEKSIIGFPINTKSENLDVSFLSVNVSKFPVNTVFMSTDVGYEVLGEETIKIIDFIPVIDSSGDPFKLGNIVEETREACMTYIVNYYLLHNETIADKCIKLYKTEYNFEINKEKRKTELLSESSTGFLTIIKSTYPCPTIDKDGFYIDEGVWNILIRNALRKKSTMLTGYSGCGKTEIVALISKAIGKTLHTQDMGTIQDTQSALLGVHRINKDGISEFETAPFVDYVKSGEMVLLDEISRSPLSAGNVLLPCLDSRKHLPLDIAGSKDERKVNVNKETMFFATANVGNEYSGTNMIDRALLDRFMIVELDFPSKENETKILVKRTEVDHINAKIIAEAMSKIRAEYDKEDLSTVVSVRHSLELASLVADGFDLKTAFKNVVYPLYDRSERVKIDTILKAWT